MNTDTIDIVAPWYNGEERRKAERDRRRSVPNWDDLIARLDALEARIYTIQSQSRAQAKQLQARIRMLEELLTTQNVEYPS